MTPGRASRWLVLCSRNEHKRRELEAALPGWRVDLLDPSVARGLPEEGIVSFVANARAKARFGRPAVPAEAWSVGEDSGLEIAALGGRPGVETARWAEGRHVERVLAALDGVAARGARYVCELVAIGPDGVEARGSGVLRGSIALAAAGSEGFGFDPVFVPDGESRTVAVLGDAWKAASSHRARAARALAEAIASLR